MGSYCLHIYLEIHYAFDKTNLQGEWKLKKFVVFRVRYIERFYKDLLSQGEQTLVRYVDSSYYRRIVLSSFFCSILKKTWHILAVFNLMKFKVASILLFLVCIPFFGWNSRCWKVWGAWLGCPTWISCKWRVWDFICIAGCELKKAWTKFVAWAEQIGLAVNIYTYFYVPGCFFAKFISNQSWWNVQVIFSGAFTYNTWMPINFVKAPHPPSQNLFRPLCW